MTRASQAVKSLTTKMAQGVRKIEWKKTHERNEALDCAVLAYAIAYLGGMNLPGWEQQFPAAAGQAEHAESDITSTGMLSPRGVHRRGRKQRGMSVLRQLRSTQRNPRGPHAHTRHYGGVIDR